MGLVEILQGRKKLQKEQESSKDELMEKLKLAEELKTAYEQEWQKKWQDLENSHNLDYAVEKYLLEHDFERVEGLGWHNSIVTKGHLEENHFYVNYSTREALIQTKRKEQTYFRYLKFGNVPIKKFSGKVRRIIKHDEYFKPNGAMGPSFAATFLAGLVIGSEIGHAYFELMGGFALGGLVSFVFVWPYRTILRKVMVNLFSRPKSKFKGYEALEKLVQTYSPERFERI